VHDGYTIEFASPLGASVQALVGDHTRPGPPYLSTPQTRQCAANPCPIWHDFGHRIWTTARMPTWTSPSALPEDVRSSTELGTSSANALDDQLRAGSHDEDADEGPAGGPVPAW